ncbi:uncharacterized protein LOC131679309 [Topomyia yanbarensis]|uniref:uncharacterized protein LOC131679309 n=1 Tax=Topomyia yanbarensis TaxID=2498891 RepID=UPI00273C0A15|nr:uncharacterized protein LOC131679309 [Topomyia yanbarensis]
MKFLIVAVLALVSIVSVQSQNKYTTKYDGVNLDEILKSDRLFNNYYKCLMDQGRCTPDGNELKRVLPDALKTACEKCSEKQKEGTERVLQYLITNRPKQWAALQQKYDPDNVYVNSYREEAKNRDIKVYSFEMNSKLSFLLVAVCFAIVVVAEEDYITKYDNIDLDEVFKSTRLLTNYMNCLKNRGPCTPDGKELKEKLPDALENDCIHCSEKQKQGADKVIHFIIENLEEDFKVLESLYDPTGEYRRKYLDDRQKFRQPTSEETTTATMPDVASSSEEAVNGEDHGQSGGR